MAAKGMATWLHKRVHERATSTVRILPRLASPPLASRFASLSASIALTLAAAACLAVSACSPGVDYPSNFPAVHDMPTARTDAPLDAQQVQQATEDLISDRNRLNSEAQGTQNKAPASPAPKSANSATAAKKMPADPTAATATAQTAGTETK